MEQKTNSYSMFGQARALLLYCADFVLSGDIKCSDMHPTALYTRYKGLHSRFFSPIVSTWIGRVKSPPSSWPVVVFGRTPRYLQ